MPEWWMTCSGSPWVTAGRHSFALQIQKESSHHHLKANEYRSPGNTLQTIQCDYCTALNCKAAFNFEQCNSRYWMLGRQLESVHTSQNLILQNQLVSLCLETAVLCDSQVESDRWTWKMVLSESRSNKYFPKEDSPCFFPHLQGLQDSYS